MEQDNKNRVVWGLEVAALVLYVLITIATCAGVWNFCPEKFVKVLAGILFLVNGYAAFQKARKLRKNYSSFIKTEEQKMAEINNKLNSKK